MNKLVLALSILFALAACKPQDPAPLPPQVGTRTPPAAPTDAPAPAPVAEPAAASTESSVAVAAAPDAAAAPAIDGAGVYQKACVTCHGTGLAGAPKLGDAADWGPRVAQGEALLVEHAIKGFTGKKGMMPPKGGFMNLSDDEVRAAVHYLSTAPAP